jgi:hypothetical protein
MTTRTKSTLSLSAGLGLFLSRYLKTPVSPSDWFVVGAREQNADQHCFCDFASHHFVYANRHQPGLFMKMELAVKTPEKDTDLHGLALMGPDVRIGVRSFCRHPCHRQAVNARYT